MQIKSFVPSGKRVLVKPVLSKDDNKTAGGIYLAGDAKSEPFERGEIISVGNGVMVDENSRISCIGTIETGKKVLFNAGSGLPIDLKGVPHKLLHPDDIIGAYAE